jgi:hypothetical protein
LQNDVNLTNIISKAGPANAQNNPDSSESQQLKNRIHLWYTHG